MTNPKPLTPEQKALAAQRRESVTLHEDAMYNQQAEAELLAAVLVDNRCFDKVSDMIEPQHFYYTPHANIWAAICEELRANRPASPVTLKQKFINQSVSESMSYTHYLGHLIVNATTTIYVKEYAKVIYDLAVRRRVYGACEKAMEIARFRQDVETNTLISEIEAALYTVSIKVGGDDAVSVKASGDRVVQKASDMMGGKLKVKEIKSGIYELDNITGPYRPGQFVVIGARPGVGKTSLMQTMAMKFARDGEKVDIYSMEMGDEEVATRILADLSGIAGSRIEAGRINEDEFREVMAAQVEMSKLDILIDPSSTITIETLSIRARRLKKTRGTGVIFVDYVQLMGAEGMEPDTPRAISAITKGLKRLAKDLGIVIFGLAQLNREVAKSADGKNSEEVRPQKHHLKGSGSFEQDADKIILIHRQTDRGKWKPEEHDAGMQDAELIVAKNRQGDEKTAYVKFEAHTTSFISKGELKKKNGGKDAESDDRPF